MTRHRKFTIEKLEPRTVFAVNPTVTLFDAISADSFDGTGNNRAHPDWGSTGSTLLRAADAEYADGVSTPGGANRPSPRAISNLLVDQGGEDILSDRFLSAMIYVWGQFIDHDLGLTPTAGVEPLDIAVPTGDPSFDPQGTGTQVIHTSRTVYDADTGTDASNPREQINTLTTWLDGSVIYGSDAATAKALRTLSGGRLKTSPGGLLPYNSEKYFPAGTLPMDNAGPAAANELFAAGDVRANENIELTSMHTLFVREHNYWAGKIAAGNRGLTDEQIYRQARAIVIAEIQSITYNEWLPALLGRGALDRYDGYDPSVNPGITNEFSTAAFRVGHTLLGDDVEFLDNFGKPVGEEVPLSGAFFNPALLAEFNIGPVLKYLASDPASEVDNKIVDGVRNFLFGPPGAGGLDLASLNIQRGRDHGLADYNDVRAAYGLRRVQSFAKITSDAEVQAKLQQAYGSVNNIDLWVGALAEDHVAGASVGPTLRAIISDQSERLRDGDRFWYERVYSGRVLDQIENTTLADVIKRNTSLWNIQDNVFFFKASIGGKVFVDADRDGRLDRDERGLAGWIVQLVSQEESEVVATATTDSRGNYAFDVLDGVRPGDYVVRVVAPTGTRGASLNLPSRAVTITRGGQFLTDVNLAMRGGIRIGSELFT